MANYKADIASKAKKTAAARQKEAQKREADSLSRKHLQGLRVVQKNLVYVTGLRPSTREDLLLQTLRGEEYFGQYGKIVKIVVSKPKGNAQGQESVGVYVTFARKEDAEACIAAVDGNVNNGRTLRFAPSTWVFFSCTESFTGHNMALRNIALLISGMRHAITKIACFFTSRVKIATASRAKTFRQ